MLGEVAAQVIESTATNGPVRLALRLSGGLFGSTGFQLFSFDTPLPIGRWLHLWDDGIPTRAGAGNSHRRKTACSILKVMAGSKLTVLLAGWVEISAFLGPLQPRMSPLSCWSFLQIANWHRSLVTVPLWKLLSLSLVPSILCHKCFLLPSLTCGTRIILRSPALQLGPGNTVY